MKFVLFFFLLVLNAGQAVNAQSGLYVAPGTILKTTGGVVITLHDIDLINDGIINQSTGEGVFRFSGTGDNTISGTNAPLFDIFQIAKAGVAKISLQQNITVNSGISFTSGLIDLNSNNIFLQPTALLNGESETSRIIGPVGGFVEITNTLNAPYQINAGNLGAIITSSANLGSTTIRRGHQSQVNGSGIGSSILRYYDIIPVNNTALDATLRFNYLDAELNGLTENVLTMWKSSNNTTWSFQGFTSKDITTNYVEKISIADFSRWTLSSPGNALPVQFLLFNVKCNTDKVTVNWKTAFEQNSNQFKVQRSNDALNWITIGTTTAAGNSAIENNYSFIDNNPVPGIAFYRVVQFDIDGRTLYTSVIKNECGQQDNWKLWPNPVQEMLFLYMSVKQRSLAIIKVYNNKGALVRQQQATVLPGTNQLNVDLRRLAAGSYIVQLLWDNGLMQKAVKIVKQ